MAPHSSHSWPFGFRAKKQSRRQHNEAIITDSGSGTTYAVMFLGPKARDLPCSVGSLGDEEL